MANVEELIAGALILPLSATASPAFQTDRHAMVTLSVAGKVFGPVRANATGAVRVPVVVPPGASIAVARSTNARGRVAEQVLDLGVPPFPRWLVLAPKAAVHMQPFEVLVFGMNADASLAPRGTFTLYADGRRAQPLQGAAGWTRFWATPPHLKTQTRMFVAAHGVPEDFRQTEPSVGNGEDAPPSQAEIALLPGPPSRITIILDRTVLTLGSNQLLTVVVRAEDMWGHPTSTANTRIYIGGAPFADVARQEQRLRFVVAAPPQTSGQRSLVVEAIDARAYAHLEVPLQAGIGQHADAPPGEPREYAQACMMRVGPTFAPNGATGFGATLEGHVQVSQWNSWPQGLFLTGAFGYQGRQQSIQSETGLSRLRMQLLPLLVGATWRIRVSPPVMVLLGVQVGPALLVVENESLGASVKGTSWIGMSRMSADVVFGRGQTQMLVGASFSDAPGGKLSSGDRLRGNLAGFAATLGVRRRW